MTKTKTVHKTTYMWYSEPKGWQTGQESTVSLEIGSFSHFFILSQVSNFSFINPWRAHCFLKFLKKHRQFCCTGFLHSSKLVHLDGKNLTCFIQNLVQISMNLVLSSKSNSKWPKKSWNQSSTENHIYVAIGV